MEEIMSRKKNPDSFIHFQTRRSDGKQYATFCPFDRKHGGKDVYLGTLVDAKENIFHNRKHGYFRFTVEGGRSAVETDEVAYLKLVTARKALAPKRTLCLDFGNAWFFDRMIDLSGLKALLRTAYVDNSDTLIALVAFKLLDDSANVYAQEWYESSYAKYLYPEASLASQRISEFMEVVGTEERLRGFFEQYIAFLKTIPEVSDGVLIDSTGLPNDISFEYTRLSNHNGVISKEARLIFIVERNTGYPVYFRYVPGNIVDVSTLRATLCHMKAQGIKVGHGILDAGYCSERNLLELFAQEIPFLIRLPAKSMSDRLIKEHGGSLFSIGHSVQYGERQVFMKCVPIDLYGHPSYAYVAIDFDRQKMEQKAYLNKWHANAQARKKMSDEELASLGYFVLISSEHLATNEVLPLYYTRQTVEQIFDHAKNDVDLLPLRAHNEATFRGHLLLSFIATVVLITINRRLKSRKKLMNFNAKAAFHAMRSAKCNVYPTEIDVTETNKNANLILKELHLDFPYSIEL
jgi:hypothetical protein